jgi:hypothetical protein
MSIAKEYCTRTQFLTLWFERLREFNLSTPIHKYMDYTTIHAIMIQSLHTDPEMMTTFTTFSGIDDD